MTRLPLPLLWRFSWLDVRAGWRDEQLDRTPGPWAPCGAVDYRAGWLASWCIR